jgi:predicted aspartyl protease
LFITGVCLVLAGCGNAETDSLNQPDHLPCHLTRVAALSYALVDGHPVIQANIDAKPASLVFDTGAFRTILTPSAAKRLELSEETNQFERLQNRTIKGIGGERTTTLYKAHQVQFGLLHGETWRFLVADLGMDTMQPAPDGSFGADLMWRYDVDFDLPNNRFILYYPEHDCSAPSVFLHGNLFAVPLIDPLASFRQVKTPSAFKEFFALSPPLHPSPKIHVTVGGKDLVAEIDTGSPTSFLYVNGAVKAGLKPEKVASDPHIWAGGIGPNRVRGFRHVMESISIGDLEIDQLPLEFGLESDDEGVDMLIGMDILRHIHMWISHSSGTVIMQYPAAPSPQLDDSGKPADKT